ncbi:MAG: hypothetical protein IJP17_07765, partial [Clostridia bacterium]|nr:hypothetical protein [Clostridia bacterium]
MNKSKKKLAAALISLLILLLSGCSILNLSDEDAIQEIAEIFPDCSVSDFVKQNGTLYVTMETERNVVFMTEYRGGDSFVSYYTTDILRANMDTIIDNAPEGISVEKDENSA